MSNDEFIMNHYDIIINYNDSLVVKIYIKIFFLTIFMILKFLIHEIIENVLEFALNDSLMGKYIRILN